MEEIIFKVSGIVILAVFYGCYFLKMIRQKKKGIQTNQMGKGKVGFVKAIEISLKVISLIVPMVEMISIITDWNMMPMTVRAIGCVIGALGDAVFVVSVVTMKDSWRAGVSETDKTDLVTDGIYQISRNPAFLGFDLVYLGILFMFFNWVLFAVSLLAALIFHLQIVNVEEDFLKVTFGNDYLEYCKHVNRYLGRR